MLINGLYSDNMVFQQGFPITLKGYIHHNEKVHIKIIKNDSIFEGKTMSNSKGEWLFEGPIWQADHLLFDIYITTQEQSQTLRNCIMGDVFLGIGQSNMAYPIKYDDDFDWFNQSKESHLVSCLQVIDSLEKDGKIIRPIKPETNFKFQQGWFTIQDNRAVNFSGLLAHFAMDYQSKSNVPVGLIDASVPGCSIESYLPVDKIKDNEIIMSYLSANHLFVDFKNDIHDEDNHYTLMSGIYHEKIAPLVHFPLAGILWYQGEHHVGGEDSATFYKESLSQLIHTYRDLWKIPKLKWLNIYIRYNYYPQDDGFSIARINEAIQMNHHPDDNIYSIPTYDYIPHWQNKHTDQSAMLIHPTNKKYIAQRLVDVYLGRGSLTEFDSYEVMEHSILIHFKHMNSWLNADRIVLGFMISDESMIYYPADAVILSSHLIEISSKYVEHPVAFTYAFESNPIYCQLKNQDGLPLPVYRSHPFSGVEKYYSTMGYEICHQNLFFEPGFDPRWSIPKLKPLWISGVLHTATKQTFDIVCDRYLRHDVLKVVTQKNDMKPSFFDISIDLSRIGSHTSLALFKYLTIVMRKNISSDVTLIGLVIKTSSHKLIGFMNGKKQLKDTYDSYTFDLENATLSDLSEYHVKVEDLKHAISLSIVIESNKKCEVLIASVNHHQHLIS